MTHKLERTLCGGFAIVLLAVSTTGCDKIIKAIRKSSSKRPSVAELRREAEKKAEEDLTDAEKHEAHVKEIQQMTLQPLKEAAENGDPDAQYELGKRYRFGSGGVEEDWHQMTKWYEKAARQGHLEAQVSLGYCYEEGAGVPQDYEKMIEWYRKAVEGGSSDALLKLGSCYEKGLGVPQDKIEAWKLYYRSKEMNDPNADSRLHTLGYRVMIQAAEMGIVEAQYALGEAYQTGKERNLEQDLELAVIWYGKAAQNGSDKAKAALNHCLYDIRIKAQENNSAYSQNILGVCYYYGYGVDKDVKQAEEWFKKAAERGNEKAENNLRRLKF